jgi:amino acid transporter
VATYVLVKRSPQLRASFRDRAYPVMGSAFAMVFIALLCIPGMPAFMAWPSWIAFAGWVALGVFFYVSRAGEYRRLDGPLLDRLILAKTPADSGAGESAQW